VAAAREAPVGRGVPRPNGHITLRARRAT
jgi:hypothetical protein